MEPHTIIELATGRTKESDVAGSVTGSTALEPTIWLQGIVDAAKTRFFFREAVQEHTLSQGQKDLVIPFRKKFLGSSGITYTTTTPNAGTGITATKIDNLDGVTVTPTPQDARISIGNYAFRTNTVNLMTAAQDELTFAIGDKIDAEIATTLGDSASTTSTVSGMQILYGGDATSDATLATGDILTTDLVATARRLLMTRSKQFRASTGNGGGFGAVQTATVSGNPWSATPDEPFIFYIGPSQEEAFLKDSQFVNAAEYGGREILLNGEIGKYVGIKIVSTVNAETAASGSEGPDAQTANAGANMTRCLLVKARACGALVWGQPGFPGIMKIFDNVPEVSQDIVLESAYAIKVIHGDAIVAVDVTDA